MSENKFNEITNFSKPVKKNPLDFVQFTRGYLQDISKLARKSLPAYEILNFLIERMDRANAIIVSQTTLAQLLNYSRQTIYSATKLLAKESWVQIVKIGTANGYIVNSKVVWRTHNGKRYGSFYAEVIASETEQRQTIEELENQNLKQIPNIKNNEIPISDNADLPPPDQRDLLAPDFDVIPTIKNKQSDDEKERLELEKKYNQQRIDE